MPYQVQQIIEGKGEPVCVSINDPVTKALALMIEHDFSQLPVLDGTDETFPAGLINYEGVLRGIRNFKAKLEDLRVRDVMTAAPVFNLDNDLFDTLDKLQNTNAVLIVDNSKLVGIVTSYDSTEYFRNKTEDLMRIEDIELMIKEFINLAYTKNGEVDTVRLDEAIGKVSATNSSNNELKVDRRKKSFAELTLNDYISLLTMKDTWAFFEPIFGISRVSVIELLRGVREIRNSLAHFRGDISAEERDKLKFSAEWLTRCQENIPDIKSNLELSENETIIPDNLSVWEMLEARLAIAGVKIDKGEVTSGFLISDSSKNEGRYTALADLLQSLPGRIDTVPLTFDQIEEVIKTNLPPSARNHRAWWANDSVGHSHSQLWLDAGWRTTYINLSEGKITFSRIQEREKAYIDFFSGLVSKLKKTANFLIRDVSPDGTSWTVVQYIPKSGPHYGSFTFSFTRDKRLRVELYLDLGDQKQTKDVFDELFGMKERFESQLGHIEWERLDNRRASRLAIYRDGQVVDIKSHAELQDWAVETMIKFFNIISEPAEKIIRKAKN
jgi:hypothetical protein